MKRLTTGLILIVFLGSLVGGAVSAATGTTELISLSSTGALGNGRSSYSAMSADGRYLAFTADATNLVDGDTNGVSDVFVRDRETGTTERVSVASDGTQANGHSPSCAISADGRYVAFSSHATNLVASDTNGQEDIFVRDRVAGTTEIVSLSSTGAQATSLCWYPAISGNGQFVAFISSASNLVPGDTNGAEDIFVRDRVAGTTEIVSLSSAGAQGDRSGYLYPSLSADGRYVAFTASATNLVTGDTNNCDDVFVRDRLTGTTERVSVSASGAQGNGTSGECAISADGRYVAFSSSASNLVPGDTNGKTDVFVRDRLSGTTERVSVAADGTETTMVSGMPIISGDGTCVAYQAYSRLPTGGRTAFDVYVRDRSVPTTERVSVSNAGTLGNGDSYPDCASTDGRYIAFTSAASNLVPDDTNAAWDVFLRDRRGSDAVPPTTTPSLTGTMGANGWYLSNVQVGLVAADADGTGIKQITYSATGAQSIPSTSVPGASASLTISADGQTIVTFFAEDNAGNVEAPQILAIKVDKNAPVLNVSAMSDGWFYSPHNWTRYDVVVSFSCSDAGSGVVSCPAPVTVSSEGADQVVTATCADNASHSTTIDFAGIDIDKTAPAIAGSRSPAANAAGWNNSDVTVTFNATDNLSGVKSLTPSTVLSAEGQDQAVTGTATDGAGNSASTTVGGISIDKTAPVLTINTPEPFALLPAGTALDFSASDGLSGIASVRGVLTDGASNTTEVASGYVPPAGVYTLLVEATDLGGNVASETRQFVIFELTSGLVTGGGWFNSPAGAYSPNPSLVDKATFGFNCKYHKGDSAPSGQMVFQLQAAGCKFQSTAYDSLSISNAKAVFKGTGIVNGAGDYGFTISISDGQISGDGIDRFRIRIWDKASGNTLYDNQQGAPDQAEPTMALAGGSLVIHKK